MVGIGALVVGTTACEEDDPDLGTTATGPGAGSGAGTTTGSPTSTSTGGNGGNGQGGNGAGAGSQGSGGAGAGGGAGPYQVCSNPPVDYPAGPYGFNEGDVFEPLELNGWTNPNPDQRIDLEPYGAYTMADIRGDHPSSFVMLHLSGMF